MNERGQKQGWHSSLSKMDWSILFANMIDHFDTSIYGYLAPIIGMLFFPTYDPISQLLLGYSTFLTSSIAKPIGVFIFGYLAKKFGALNGLTYSLLGVGVGTALIGCIPIYKDIGWLATFLLVFIRVIRGICASGEAMIAKLYIVEGKDYTQGFKASSYYQISVVLGNFIASIVTGLLISYYADVNIMDDNMWRVCFILGGSVGFISVYIRYIAHKHTIAGDASNNDRVRKVFDKIGSKDRLRELINRFKLHSEEVTCDAVVTAFGYMTYCVPFILMNGLIPLCTDISKASMMQVNSVCLIIDIICLLIFSKILERFHNISIMRFIYVVFAILSPILFWFIPNSDIWYVTFVRLVIVILGVAHSCQSSIYIKQLFGGDDDRYLLSGLSHTIGALFGMQLSPIVSTLIWKYTGNMGLVGALYSVLAIVAYHFVYKHYKRHPEHYAEGRS